MFEAGPGSTQPYPVPKIPTTTTNHNDIQDWGEAWWQSRFHSGTADSWPRWPGQGWGCVSVLDIAERDAAPGRVAGGGDSCGCGQVVSGWG
jgi:hypothetical protein